MPDKQILICDVGNITLFCDGLFCFIWDIKARPWQKWKQSLSSKFHDHETIVLAPISPFPKVGCGFSVKRKRCWVFCFPQQKSVVCWVVCISNWSYILFGGTSAGLGDYFWLNAQSLLVVLRGPCAARNQPGLYAKHGLRPLNFLELAYMF